MLKTAFNPSHKQLRIFKRDLDTYHYYVYKQREQWVLLSYLFKEEDLHFPMEVGWIMVAFGMGSMLGRVGDKLVG
jgi:hypothetical protein